MNRILLILLGCSLPFLSLSQNYSIQLQSGIFLPDAKKVTATSSELVKGKYYRYIQFFNIPTDEEKKNIEAKGVRLFSYVPNNSFLAAIPSELDLLTLGENVRSVIPIAPQRKLDAMLAKKELPDWAMRGKSKIELVVMHHPDLNSFLVAEWLKSEGAEVLHVLDDQDAHRIVIRIALIDKIAALPYVYFIETADPEPTPDNLVGRTNHRSNMLATDYDGGLKYDGAGVSVALNDDGVIGPHIDYQGRIISQFITFNNGNHGDHCAGTIFGAGNRNPTTRGMAFGASLGVYGVGSSFANYYQAFDSIYNHYVKHNIRITSTSYSDGNNAGYTSRARLMDIHINNLQDLTHVFSAGNAGTANYNYGAGAGWGNITGGHKQAKNVIAVGNLTYQDALNSSSSRGPAKDGRVKPDICAVGTSVYSTVNPNTYSTKTGTSMSCPGVAGTVAQLYHAYKTLNSGVNPPSALIKAAVLNTGDDLGNPGPDYKHGWGRINARRALKILENNQYLLDSVSQGGNKTHPITVPAGVAELRVMVYWHDKEATAGAAKALVNNLNMTVITPASQQVYPWVLDKTATVAALNANALQGVDTLNNVEQVTIPAPAAGTYTVTVNGFSVPSGPQKYVVVYEFVVNDLTLIYPSGGESLVPGTQETIRWDAYGNSGTFTLQYSANNGASWTNIASNISASQRYYNWIPPSGVTGQALVKVTRGSLSDVSDTTFSIIGRPGTLTVDWVCMDSMKVSYTAVSGATGYVVSILGSTYMDSVAFSTTTSCVVKGINTLTAGWFSVHAIGPNNCKGRRADAISYPAVPFNCALPDDIGVVYFVTPSAFSVINCQAGAISDSVRIQIKNNGSTGISNIIAKYTVNGGAPVVGGFAGTINPGATVTYTFPQPVVFNSPGTYQLTAWTEHPSDMTPGNDTITWEKNILQPAVVTLPHYQDFEGFALCDTTNNCEQEICALGSGWTNSVNFADDQIDWRVHTGPTPTNNELGTTGPVMDFNPGTATGKYAYLEATGCNTKPAHLVSPCIDLSGSNNPQLSFACHMFGSGMGSLYVDVLSNGQWVNTIMPSISGNQGNTWQTFTGSLAAFAGQVINVRFRGVTGGTEASDMAIDDIKIYEGLGVNGPATSVIVQVFPNPSKGIFEVRMGKINTPVTLTVTDVNAKVILQQNLLPSSGNAFTEIDLGKAAAGVYFLSVKSEEGTVNKKLVKY